MGEVIVVDNGSTDRSAEVAESAGARDVYEPQQGYGSAYLRGLAEARGDYIVMADGDGTYDLRELGEFVDLLEAGDDLVIGSRFRGRIHRGKPLLDQFIDVAPWRSDDVTLSPEHAQLKCSFDGFICTSYGIIASAPEA